MDFWDEINNSTPNEENKEKDYIDALNFISKITSINAKKNTKEYLDVNKVKKLDYLIDYNILSVLKDLNVSNEIRIRQRLEKISDQIEQYKRVLALSNKTVIGIGGKFSAGKSSFINALLDINLPQSQSPTTSIATYVIHSDVDSMSAYTINNQEIFLNESDNENLTHKFYNDYKINLKYFIDCLLVRCTSDKINKDIAILDTPGYNKYDTDDEKARADGEIARAELKLCDFLIWLVDIENGVIMNDDLKFLRKLNIATPILVILTKYDKKESQVDEILSETKKTLEASGINIYGVTAYSSQNDYMKEYNSNLIETFIENASNYSNRVEDIKTQFIKIIEEIEKDLEIMKADSIKKRNSISNIIFNCNNVLQISSFAKVRKDILDDLYKMNTGQIEIKKIKSRVIRELNKIMKGGVL